MHRAGHLVEFVGAWRLWRVARLRGAGFAGAEVQQLEMLQAASAADALRDAEVLVKKASEDAHGRLEQASIDVGRSPPPFDRLLRQVEAGKPIASEWRDALAPCTDALVALQQAQARFTDAFRADRLKVSRAIRDVLGSAAFAEAVTWQNRRALDEGLRNLQSTALDKDDKRTRQREQAVAMYLQRYCVKNDTIGFFGPVAWAALRDDVRGLRLSADLEPLRQRTVYFELWGIKALADLVSEDNDVLLWMSPRRHPSVRLDEDTLHHPVDGPIALPGPLLRLLHACDGRRPAHQIAADAVAEGGDDLTDSDDVYAALSALAQAGLVLWRVEVSPEELLPDQGLRRSLAAIGDEGVRARASAGLDRLDVRRREVADARGAPHALGAALTRFDLEFEAITGQRATRGQGQTYAGRQLLFEDCRRGVDVDIGSDVLARAAPACGLLLQSARWYTFETAQRYRTALGQCFDEVTRETGQPVVELRRFWESAKELFPGGHLEGSIVAQVVASLRRKWTDLLDLPRDARRVERSAEALAPRVAEAFAAQGPGWPNARYQSLDLMIAARSIDEIARGEHLVVLGELHTGMNTVLSPVFSKEYPDLKELLGWRAIDVEPPCIAPTWSFARSRADYFSLVPGDLALECGVAPSWRARAEVIAESECVVERVDGLLQVRTRDHRRCFDIIRFLEHHLVAESHAHFQLASAVPHAPRVTIDGLVLWRETWRMASSDLPFREGDAAQTRFAIARQWADRHRLPRFVFAKVPNEAKPFFVDFASSLGIENFMRIVRQASAVVLSEMLPTLEQLWLADGQGKTYTSELRTVAVDPEPFRDPLLGAR